MRKDFFSTDIIEWYHDHHRDLPWRKTHDPYNIWLSEIILQQTRVAQGLPYYEEFVTAFPTIFDLAKAPLQRVLRLWQGLGYYSRARNLHQCAMEIVKKYNGVFPNSFAELKKLKGVGPYTAAAIASFAFRESVAVVDGNVFRVLARVFGIDKDIASQKGKDHFFSLASELIDKKRPDLFNQAVMEFGALHCLPKNPKCNDCIFSKKCQANRRSLQPLLPVKSKKQKVRTRYFNYFVIRSRNKIFMHQRNGNDIWRGLYDFYLIEITRRRKTESLIQEDKFLSESRITSESKTFTHILSHQKLKVKFIDIEIPPSKRMESTAKKIGLRSFSRKQISKLPKPILIERFLQSNP